MAKMTLKDRLRLAMKGPPVVSGADLARACGIKPPSVSDWLSGKTKSISEDNARKAALRLGINVSWLVLGEGPMKGGAPTDRDGTKHAVEPPDNQPLRPEWIAETARTLRLSAAEDGKRFDIETSEGSDDFAFWYGIRTQVSDVSALSNVVEMHSRRARKDKKDSGYGRSASHDGASERKK